MTLYHASYLHVHVHVRVNFANMVGIYVYTCIHIVVAAPLSSGSFTIERGNNYIYTCVYLHPSYIFYVIKYILKALRLGIITYMYVMCMYVDVYGNIHVVTYQACFRT